MKEPMPYRVQIMERQVWKTIRASETEADAKAWLARYRKEERGIPLARIVKVTVV